MSFIRPAVYEAGLPRKARSGDGWLAFPQKTNQTTNSNQVISTSAILGGLYVRSGTNTNRTDTTDIATAILAAMPEMNIGSVYMFMVANQTANTLYIAGGTDVTPSGSLSVLTLTTKWFMLTKTSDTTMTLEGF